MDLVKWGLAISCACLMAYIGVLKQDIADRDNPKTLKKYLYQRKQQLFKPLGES